MTAEVRLPSVWLVGYVNASHGIDSKFDISPKMLYGMFDCDTVMLQNYMLMTL